MPSAERRWAWPQPYELVDHTADTGVRVSGATPEETLARLVLAQAQLLAGGVLPEGEARLQISVAASSDLSLVAVDLLRELLRRFAVEQVIAHTVEAVALAEDGVCLRVVCGLYDPARHADATEIKAVTFHQAHFAHVGDHYVAQVLFDV
jgi:SHS2 domain-containing protein